MAVAFQERDQVDLWIRPLPLPDATESALLETLSVDERERAARCVNHRARSHFVAGRAVLRRLLQHYLGLPAKAVRLVPGTYGKPQLEGVHALSFNLAHADGLLLVALGAGLPVGVDVEKIRPVPEAARWAARHLTAPERTQAEAGPAEFLRMWTCRESVVKALGAGVSHGWDAFRLVRQDHQQAHAVGLGQDCHVRSFSPLPGYVAALAALAPRFQLRHVRLFPLTDPTSEGSLPC